MPAERRAHINGTAAWRVRGQWSGKGTIEERRSTARVRLERIDTRSTQARRSHSWSSCSQASPARHSHSNNEPGRPCCVAPHRFVVFASFQKPTKLSHELVVPFSPGARHSAAVDHAGIQTRHRARRHQPASSCLLSIRRRSAVRTLPLQSCYRCGFARSTSAARLTASTSLRTAIVAVALRRICGAHEHTLMRIACACTCISHAHAVTLVSRPRIGYTLRSAQACQPRASTSALSCSLAVFSL